MKNRYLKMKSLIMPKWCFWFYQKYYYFKKNILKIKKIEIRKKWFSFYITKWKHFSITWTEADYDDQKPTFNISILWFHLYIYTSQKCAVYNKNTYDYNQGERDYGIAIHNNGFWIYKGLKNKKYEFPYTYEFIRHSILKKDGNWEHDYSKKGAKAYKIKNWKRKNFYDGKIWKNIFYEEIFDYTYILKSGTIQKRKATIKVEEREWRRKFLIWTKWKNKTKKVIEINFNEEVGEESGSWKGGVIGISFKMLPNETPEQCLRRFEKTVKL